ncbi:thymus-specific serine protease [Centropristis striata]|uniref:thymus-specific serine protease n=1 Tax=Centropristis striata TaxID=184440 RepID=UPI0027DF082A|nr:thymus-specific serine protease [Centropristis striata]
MLFSPARGLILLFLFDFTDAGRIFWKIKERVRNLQLQKAKQHLQMHTLRGQQLLQHVKEGRVHQQLDHFNRQDMSSFPQRFFVNEAYWQRPDGPVFLFVGGEGPIFEFDVLAGHHVDMAKEHGALLLAVEHRFYGDSINPDGLKTENLADLSSQQALADLAVFHQYISHSFNLSHRNTWISFGGSYSGALSAWFRGKFPHLVYGAVASSAPVKATLDFSAYSNTVGSSLRNEAVGGSPKCLAAVQEAFAAVEALMSRNGSQVAEDFGCCQIPKDADDQIELMQNLADIFMGSVQYNEEGVLMSINDLCGLMTNKSEETEAYNRLVKLSQIYHSTSEEPCLDISHEKTVKDLMDTSLHSGRRAERQWTYQTCTEFGFYQTCEDTSCPFSGRVTLQIHTELCLMLFGISQHSLPGRVAFTNSYYGGDDPETHRVLYVNGGVDPWKELSVVQDGTEDGEDARVVFIKDTAHCADMMRRRVTDRCSLKKAREEIEEHVSRWLKTGVQEKTENRIANQSRPSDSWGMKNVARVDGGEVVEGGGGVGREMRRWRREMGMQGGGGGRGGGKPAPCGVKSPLAAGTVRGPLTGRPTVKLHAAHGDAYPGPMFPATPLLIEVQPPPVAVRCADSEHKEPEDQEGGTLFLSAPPHTEHRASPTSCELRAGARGAPGGGEALQDTADSSGPTAGTAPTRTGYLRLGGTF